MQALFCPARGGDAGARAFTQNAEYETQDLGTCDFNMATGWSLLGGRSRAAVFCRGRRPRRPAWNTGAGPNPPVGSQCPRLLTSVNLTSVSLTSDPLAPGPWIKKQSTLPCAPLCRRRPIFPGRCPPSLFGAVELNYRVRDGNGWDLNAIDTDCTHKVLPACLIILAPDARFVKSFFSFFRVFRQKNPKRIENHVVKSLRTV